MRKDCSADSKNAVGPTARLAVKKYKTMHEKRERRTDAVEDPEKHTEGEGEQNKIAAGTLAGLSFLRQ